MARTFNTMLTKSGETGHPCSVPDLRGNYFKFCSEFLWMDAGFCQMRFCFSLDNHLIFIPLFINVINHSDLWILKHLYIPGINATRLWHMVKLINCWIQLLIICSRILHLCISMLLAYNLCVCDVLVWYWNQSNAGFSNVLGEFSLSKLLESLKKVGYQIFECFLNSQVILPFTWGFSIGGHVSHTGQGTVS